MAISEQISCMECGGTAVLQQLPADDEVIEAGDVLTYRCPDCWQRWDVVVDEDDVDADDADDNR
jgi:DNA-directed RNA polymerase subunit RPC12/RpoP